MKRLFFVLVWIALILPHTASALTGEQIFYQTQADYQNFLDDSQKIKYRHNWLVYGRGFQQAYEKDPDGPLASAALYKAGEVYQKLYRYSHKSGDSRKAIALFRKVRACFSDSQYAQRAKKGLLALGASLSPQKARASCPLKVRKPLYKRSKARYKARAAERSDADIARLLAHGNRGSRRHTARDSDLPSTTIQGLRVWSNPNYTRVVVDADEETSYTYKFLEEDPARNKPPRLYVDFDNSRLGRGIERIVPINDNLLIDARAGQYRPDSVRVVVDINSFKTYKIFSLKNPFRTVIDVWGRGERFYAKRKRSRAYSHEGAQKPARSARRSSARSKALTASVAPEEPVSPEDLAKQLALGVRRIVIDPGHGGKDGGAPGYRRGVNEKDIVLSIARRLARKIRRTLKCEVILTRSSDRYLTLEERTAIANTQNADLFISIHTNAHKKRSAYGIETYYLNLATDKDAARVAARENATSTRNISDLEAILNDLMQNAKINESSRLATQVQNALYSHLKHRYSHVKNKGVKQAPFYVLLGAQMPAILVETSFISNKRECARLMTAKYQDDICNAIVQGICAYIRKTNPMAFLQKSELINR